MGHADPPQHVAARKQHPMYTRRFPVPDAYVAWTVPYAAYKPTRFEHPVVHQNADNLPTGGKWADVADVKDVPDLYERMSFEHVRLHPNAEGHVADSARLRDLQAAGVQVVPSAKPTDIHMHTHTHTYTHICIHMYICSSGGAECQAHRRH